MVILRELDDPRLVGMPSITRVKLSEDFSIADVYVTIMGTPGQRSAALNALRHSAGLMRGRLGKSLSLRVAPFIKFHLDENLRREMEVLELLHKIELENAAKQAAADGTAPSDQSDDDGDGPADPDAPEAADLGARGADALADHADAPADHADAPAPDSPVPSDDAHDPPHPGAQADKRAAASESSDAADAQADSSNPSVPDTIDPPPDRQSDSNP